MTSIIKVDEIQTKAGNTPSLSDLGVVKSGTVLEEIHGFCDGRTVSGITFPTVTATQNLTTTHTDLTGSNITYTPPPEAKTVVYTFSFQFNPVALSGISHFKFFIDSDEVSTFRRTQASAYDVNTQANLRFAFEYPILIGHTSNEPQNAKLTSWTTPKTLKMQGREYDGSSYQSQIHLNDWWDGASASGSNALNIPSISLKAIA